MTTFFTSNLTILELEYHLPLAKSSLDKVKARRIIERIKQLTLDMEIITDIKRIKKNGFIKVITIFILLFLLLHIISGFSLILVLLYLDI